MSSISHVQTLPGSKPELRSQVVSWLPLALPIVGAVLMVLLRIQVGEPKGLLYDGSLIVLAVICYLMAAVIGLIELYASQPVLGRWGLWLTSAGLFFNAASWGTRWVTAGDLDQWQRWVFRYFPLTNLYDYSIAFAMGAALATVIICRQREHRAVMGLSMLLASLIILLAMFIGRDFITLQPVLDSYWRPIHVGIASLSYGVTLVCFSVAVLYLLKDRVPVEAFGIFVALFGLGIYASINRGTLLPQFQYSLATMWTHDGRRSATPFRADIPYAGELMVLAAALLAVALVCFALDFYKNQRSLGRWGHLALRSSVGVQAGSLAVLFYQMKSIKDIAPRVDVATQLQYPAVIDWLGESAKGMSRSQLATNMSVWFNDQNQQQTISLSPNSNPVELGALIALLVLTGLAVLFSFRTERLIERLPSLQRLDGLVYKTAAVAFVGLAMLLITGAVWANESWGRYWGWDSKETGAFVAWVAYAGYLHTRVAHGWSGRRSAYFAIAGFLLVIFTYLGVSYLLPGLHSYA